VKGLLLILACLFSITLHAQESPEPQDPAISAMRDSLELGIGQLDGWYRSQEREAGDSLKQAIQTGPALAWRDWAMKYAPRKGMTGEDILRLADLHARLNAFDMTGAYNEQLECYKRAMLMPDTEERALYRLHAEYLSAGFAPGMIQTGARLLELDKERAMAQGVARTMALAYYFVGDRKEATRWVKRHLREHPGDRQAKDLKRRIKTLQPLQP
jgi:tetratricopeptide (TPR) repeat protein